MTPREIAVYPKVNEAFMRLARDLDAIANKHGLDSVAMMGAVHNWGDFPAYYAEWIHTTWENWMPADAPELDEEANR